MRPKTKLSPDLVISAYIQGIFPMYISSVDDIGWYQPDPRAVIPLDGFYISRSLAKTLKSNKFEVTFDRDFEGVMKGCADRPEGTWISEEFFRVFGELHARCDCHSVEVWYERRLVGGVYGVALGGAFMAESMFHYITDASKVALAHLVQHLRNKGFILLDVQYLTPHLVSLGAVEIPHEQYMERLDLALDIPTYFGEQ